MASLFDDIGYSMLSTKCLIFPLSRWNTRNWIHHSTRPTARNGYNMTEVWKRHGSNTHKHFNCTGITSVPPFREHTLWTNSNAESYIWPTVEPELKLSGLGQQLGLDLDLLHQPEVPVPSSTLRCDARLENESSVRVSDVLICFLHRISIQW